jgi:probable rRNA maturation factor
MWARRMLAIEKTVDGVSEHALARFARRARQAAGVHGKVNITLISNRRMKALNRSYRGQDKVTDVLSFPAIPAVAHDFAGDIVISGEQAARQAREFGHDTVQELKVLILHGMLHLAGMDHESDSGQMARREERLRRQLHLRDGLIARVRHGSSTRVKRRRKR